VRARAWFCIGYGTSCSVKFSFMVRGAVWDIDFKGEEVYSHEFASFVRGT
jgi:hypothetical protein